jgi:hypothetical protein
MNTRLLGHPEIIFGVVELKSSPNTAQTFRSHNRSTHVDVEDDVLQLPLLTSNEVIGLRVSYKQSVHQVRAWESLSNMTTLTAAWNYTLFPLPLAAKV